MKETNPLLDERSQEKKTLIGTTQEKEKLFASVQKQTFVRDTRSRKDKMTNRLKRSFYKLRYILTGIKMPEYNYCFKVSGVVEK